MIIRRIYYGTTPIRRVYLGGKIVWSWGEELSIDLLEHILSNSIHTVQPMDITELYGDEANASVLDGRAISYPTITINGGSDHGSLLEGNIKALPAITVACTAKEALYLTWEGGILGCKAQLANHNVTYRWLVKDKLEAIAAVGALLNHKRRSRMSVQEALNIIAAIGTRVDHERSYETTARENTAVSCASDAEVHREQDHQATILGDATVNVAAGAEVDHEQGHQMTAEEDTSVGITAGTEVDHKQIYEMTVREDAAAVTVKSVRLDHKQDHEISSRMEGKPVMGFEMADVPLAGNLRAYLRSEVHISLASAATMDHRSNLVAKSDGVASIQFWTGELDDEEFDDTGFTDLVAVLLTAEEGTVFIEIDGIDYPLENVSDPVETGEDDTYTMEIY